MSVTLPLIPTPSDYSTLDAAELEAIHLPVINEPILRALLQFHLRGASSYEDTLERAAEMLFTTLNRKKKSEDGVQGTSGSFSSGNRANEKTVSGIFAASLQHIMSRIIKVQPEDIDEGLVSPVLVCCQQIFGAGSNDVTVYRNSPQELHPRIIFNIGLHDMANDGQLLAHVNNADSVMGSFYDLCMLGVAVLLLAKRMPTYRMYAYTKVMATPTQPKVASVLISEGIWNIDNLQNILRVIVHWCRLPSKTFSKPLQPLTPHDTIRNVLVVEEGGKQMVYKVFDHRAVSQIHRTVKYNLTHIPGAELVVDTDRLQVLKYPRIPGEHLPTRSKAVVGALKKLQEIHAANVIHMDIRASNCVFNNDTGESCLIDFDFSGLAGRVRYPASFRTQINDGARHPGAQPNQLGQIEHDNVAMSAVLRLSMPADGALQHQWDLICDLVANGDLGAAVAHLESTVDISLLPNPAPVLAPVSNALDVTGSLPSDRKRKGEALPDWSEMGEIEFDFYE